MAITKSVLKNGLMQLHRLYPEGFWPPEGSGWKRLENDWQMGLMGMTDENFSRALKFFPRSQQAKYMKTPKPGPADLLVALDEAEEREREQAVSDRSKNQIHLPKQEEKAAKIDGYLSIFKDFTKQWKENMDHRDKLWRSFCLRIRINGQHMPFPHLQAFNRIWKDGENKEKLIEDYCAEVNG